MNKSNDPDFTITLEQHKDKIVRMADELERKTASPEKMDAVGTLRVGEKEIHILSPSSPIPT